MDRTAAVDSSGLHQQIATTLAAHLQPDPIWRWSVNGHAWVLDLTRPNIMGIVNVTLDSFSGDGLAADRQAAIASALAMAEAGADMLDIGGESTRPGAGVVSVDEELERVIPVVEELVGAVAIPVAVDTSKPEVMRAAIAAGAALINDVTALRGAESDLHAGEATARMLAATQTPAVLMHMQNRPQTMQKAPHYDHVVAEVYDFLQQRRDLCVACGMPVDRLICDPGIGFGKNGWHNLALLRRRRVFRGLGLPLLLGFSRKRLLGELTGIADPQKRDLASHILSAVADAAIVRVHDVSGARQALHIMNGWRHSVRQGATA
ncbi:MAG: dihydropteroate synthase [Magnetococcales bacterium]|nr:dihydropteroate synthase [Magnetococcales bacterium]NGZ05802.1 dihydropteroate synthase [Magnetococcales bacterium]